ncbi:MAG: thermonuclease family protein [Proteobacteria bacterium]|nr:thermonuclease family protein [Pseudomonadota bacterium]
MTSVAVPAARASAEPCLAAARLEPTGAQTIETVGATGTLSAKGGQEIRLAGLGLPKPALGQDPAAPLAEAVRQVLADLLVGRTVTLYHGARRRDRYDRVLAHLCLQDGTWLQGWLLGRGHAWVATTRQAADLATEMLAIERKARAERSGIWGDRHFRIRNPHETRRDIDTFQIVEGRVVSAVVIKGRAYLNFGPNWRTDFTFSVSPRDRRLFDRAGIDLAALTGQRVRGRGWVTLRNGPLIELTHPAQLEILEE